MRGHHHYTDTEKKWLISQDPDLTYKELTQMFNEKFSADVSRDSISDLMCKRLKAVSRTNNSKRKRFTKGAKPKYNVGDEIIKAGYVYVKVDDRYFEGKCSFENYRQNWRRKSDLVWEEHHGAIPEGWFVVFLDGNPMDCSIENLAVVNRSIHAVMCKNRWYSEDREQTCTALKWCDLFYEIKDAKERL